MSDALKSRLQYYRSSLADGDRMDIPYSTVQEKGRLVSSLSSVAKADVAALFQGLDASEMKVRIWLSPLRLTRRASDGWKGKQSVVLPFWVPAELDREGNPWPPTDGGAAPWFVRGVLSPNDHLPNEYPCLTSVEAVDSQVSWAEFPQSDWPGYWGAVQGYFRALAGARLEELAIEGWECTSKQVAILPASLTGLSGRILGLYDQFLGRDPSEWPTTLETVLGTGAREAAQVTAPEDFTLQSGHHGQMGASFPLSPSQRLGLALLEKTPSGGVLAVNGPPGTGKTTLIQSVVANLVVRCFLDHNRPPLILGSSANNKAITNILDSFRSVVPEAKFRNGLNERWLPQVDALGHYLATNDSTVIQNAKEAKYWITTKGTGAVDTYLDYCGAHSREQCEDYFLSKHRGHFVGSSAVTTEQAKAEIRQRLASGVAEVDRTLQTVRDLRDLCREFDVPSSVLSEIQNAIESSIGTSRRRREVLDSVIASEGLLPKRPWFLVRWLIALQKGSSVLRRARVQSALSAVEDLGFVLPDGTLDHMSTAIWNHRDHFLGLETRLRSLWQGLKDGWKFLCELEQRYLHAGHEVGAWEEMVQAQMDLTIRHECFWYALHGIELLWLQKRDDKAFGALNQGQRGTEDRWRQVAYLTPVFVSTFHSLPGFFSYSKMNPQGGWENVPLGGYVDLLVVDEAGQVAPELGVAAFGLAQKALVVGDVQQLEPIWSIGSESIDYSNATRSGVAKSREDYSSFRDSQCGCLNGSLMRLAQAASQFHYPVGWPDGGTLLTEHRRCAPSIVEFCNRFVYDGLLQIKTKTLPESSWPRLGYCHIPGESLKVAGSLTNELEARAIAVWVRENHGMITANGDLGQRLAIVTPFRAQKWLILQALKEQGVDTKNLVVGTVHALQGAERPIVLFSPVYGRNVRTGSLFFNQSYNMLNVAISRAKEHFLVFGTMSHFQNTVTRTPSGDLGLLLFRSPDNELSSEFFYSETALPVFGANPIDRISELEVHRRALRKALETAQDRVIIVSPFIAQAALEADNLPELIRAAILRGVATLVFTDESLDLHQGILRPGAAQGRQTLLDAGVSLTVLRGIHNKALVIDRRVVIEGSFNWLSAVRDRSSSFSRKDTSIVLNPPYSEQFIERLEGELGIGDLSGNEPSSGASRTETSD